MEQIKSKRTKATSIPKAVRLTVWERDGHCCILCGRADTAAPNAHYISRGHGGIGVEQNIVTLCIYCHQAYDNSDQRSTFKERIKEYLISHYPDWDESNYIYRKWDTYVK